MTIHYGTTEAEYEAMPGLRISSVKAVLNNAAQYKHDQENPPDRDTFRIGNAIHDLTLTKGSSTILVDAPDWKTKAAREAKEAAVGEGKYPLNRKEHADAQAMADALRRNEHLAQGLITGRTEVAITGTDAATFTPMKSRLDVLDIPARRIYDIKTVSGDVEPDTFASHVARYGYHIQAPQYIDITATETGTDPDEWEFIFVIVKKKAPFLTFTVSLDAPALERGRQQRTRGIAKLRECERTGIWPGYDQRIKTVSLPRWY